MISRDQLRNQIRKREFLPVYVLYGEETFLRDNAAKTIAEYAFSEGDFRDFNDDHFSLNIPESITTALAAANQLPMMAARRVIRITDVRVSTSSMKDTLKEDAEGVLSSYLANPSPSSIVIFIADELNSSRKLGKLLKSNPGAVEFCAPDDDEIRRWTQDVFKKAGVSIDPAALRRLVDLVGCDLRRATTEAQKLCTASLPEKHIDLELVDSLIRDTSELTFSSFAEHLVGGRNADAIAALENVLDNGGEPVALIGTLAWRFRDELKRLNPGVRSDHAERLAYALQRIAATDLAIKTSVGGSGPSGSRRQIEMLVCELAKR